MPTTAPLNINAASVEELERLPGLTRVLAEAIVRYRTEVGAIRTVWELAALPGFEPKLVQALAKVVSTATVAAPPVATWVVRAQAVGAAAGQSAGHRVAVRFERRVVGKAAAGALVTWQADSVSAFFDAQDHAVLRLPVVADLRGELAVEVFAPQGQSVALRPPTRWPVGQVGDTMRLDFTPATPVALRPAPAGQPAERVRLKGQVLDLAGRRIVSRQVILFGTDRPEPAPGDFRALGVATTDGQGLFALRWPEGPFTEAYGHVAIGPGQRVPIHLTPDGTLPRTVLLVVDLSQLPPEEAEASCCAPGGVVPRGPDGDDLAATDGVFSQDLGGGRCVDFTKPERVLEEYTYQFVVRTIPPVIQPLRLTRPAGVALQAVSAPASGTSGAQNASTGTSSGSSVIDLLRGNPWTRDFLRTLSPQAPRSVDRVAVSVDTPIDWDDEPTAYQATTVAHGHILTYKQQWVADGYSMGTLLYSLPLAPGQKKQIAIVDWERRETASRSEVLSETEQLQASLTRDRDINDIVKANLAERGEGSSSAFNIGGGIGHGSSAGAGAAGSSGGAGAAGGGGAVDGFAGAIGFASSGASQNFSRDVSSSALQTLRDRTMQGASAIRNRRSTVVQSVTQGERLVAQSESVANYNHCHAITMQYFEVLRHLLVRQRLVQVQECLFIPLAITPFDPRRALQWREPLRRFLRDGQLAGAFDALERVVTTDDGDPVGSYADQRMTHLSGRLWLRFQFVSPARQAADDAAQAATYDPNAWAWFDSWASFFGMGARDLFNRLRGNAQTVDEEFHRTVAPRLARAIADQLVVKANITPPPEGGVIVDPGGEKLPLDLTLVSEYHHDTALEVMIRLKAPLQNRTRASIRNLWIAPVPSARLPLGSRIVVESGVLEYRTAYSGDVLFRDGAIRDDLTSNDGVFLDTSALSVEEQRVPMLEDVKLANRLLAHLNDNLEYYHKAIWVSMSPDRRYLMLDGFTAPNTGGSSLASVVDNQIVGIVGNSLVMPVARGVRLDTTFKRTYDEAGEEISLFDHYQPLTPDDPLRIALPTKGIYAEAVMGQCNSCEHKEEDRFWRWEESPIPDGPTPIQPLSTDSRRSEAPNLKPEGFSTPIINMQTAPAAPDPTALANALQLLSNPNLFRDLTGLEGNQRNALEAMKSSLQAAQQFGAEAADVAKTFGQYATNMAMQQSTGQNMERINRAISTARSSGLISDDQAGDLTHSALQALVGRGVGSDSASDTRTARERLDLLQRAEADGAIDPETGRQGRATIAHRLANDGEPPSDRLLTPATADRIVDQAGSGASVDVRDGDRSVSVTHRGGGQSSAPSAQHVETNVEVVPAFSYTYLGANGYRVRLTNVQVIGLRILRGPVYPEPADLISTDRMFTLGAWDFHAEASMEEQSPGDGEPPQLRWGIVCSVKRYRFDLSYVDSPVRTVSVTNAPDSNDVNNVPFMNATDTAGGDVPIFPPSGGRALPPTLSDHPSLTRIRSYGVRDQSSRQHPLRSVTASAEFIFHLVLFESGADLSREESLTVLCHWNVQCHRTWSTSEVTIDHTTTLTPSNSDDVVISGQGQGAGNDPPVLSGQLANDLLNQHLSAIDWP